MLARVFAAAQPWEGCALLLGSSGSCTHLQQIWPCLNTWPSTSERDRRFCVDPREQLHAQRWARQRGLAVIGSGHSHPCSRPIPSALDRELAVAPALLLIAGPPTATDNPPSAAVFGWEWAFWWVNDQPADDQLPVTIPLPWTMAD